MTEALMALVVDYGAPAMAVILAINCLGVPFPTSLLMLAIGSLIAQGDLDAGTMIAFSIAGAVAGDMGGFALGRLGGAAALPRIVAWLKLEGPMARATDFVHRRGGAGIFFSRWLVSPLGPYVNFVAGAARYPWPAFIVWDVLGETVWVLLYVGLGMAFSRSIQAVAAVLGDLVWFVVFALVALGLGILLLRRLRRRGAIAPQ